MESRRGLNRLGADRIRQISKRAGTAERVAGHEDAENHLMALGG